jgi:hypothetical protein
MVERRTFALLRAGYIINGTQRNLHYRKRIFGAKGRKKRHRQLIKGGKKTRRVALYIMEHIF